jgi:uncharacterized protein YhjY with autotransporter beta-barrel domain
MKIIKILLCMSLFYVGYSEAACTGTSDIVANADGDICINQAIIEPSNRGMIVQGYDNVTLENRRTILLSSEDHNGIALNFSDNSTLINSGSITGDGFAAIYAASGSVNTISNSGNIDLTPGFGIYNYFNSSIVSITNTLTGIINIQQAGIYNESRTSSSADDNGNVIETEIKGSIGTITNDGTISSSSRSAIENYGSIGTINNTGQLLGGTGVCDSYPYQCGGINNDSGTIGTLNNAQFGLTYEGQLPEHYNIILGADASSYGTVHFTYPNNFDRDSGKTIFGIAGSIKSTEYLGVFSNLYPLLLSLDEGSATTKSDIYRSAGINYNYQLVLRPGTEQNAEGTYIWDLFFPDWVYIPSGPTAADTQASLNTQAHRLRSTFNSTMASSNFANMNTYDCNLFDKNNMCISAGGRYTNVDNPSSNNSAAVVVLGYKVNSNIRIGGFLDQSINNNTPTGINVSNKNPMMGAFAVWNKNADGLGYQVKIANAYQDKDVRSTRDAFGETGEAGTGKTNLNTQSYVGELSYAFNYQDSTIVRPYFALRYTNIKQDAYTEDSTVSTPLSYAKLGDRSTTALMGVKLNHSLTPRTNLTASLGIEQDINHKTDQLTASGVADLTSENFNSNIKRTRPVASAGAYYAVAKNQRLSGEVYYQQLPFQSTGSTTAYFNYMIGF